MKIMTTVLQTRKSLTVLALAFFLTLAPVFIKQAQAACGDGILEGGEACDYGTGTLEDGKLNNGEVCAVVPGQQTCEWCSNDCKLKIHSDINCSIRVQKSVNPSNCITPGGTPNYSYKVTNTGNVPLFSINLTDDKIGAVACPKTTLLAGESMTCTKTGDPITQNTTNTATVRGNAATYGNQSSIVTHQSTVTLPICDTPTPPPGTPKDPGILIRKSANPSKIKEGKETEITYTYKVTNTGKVKLTEVKVTDDKLGDIACPKKELNPSESMTCEKKAKIKKTTTNVVTVTGKTPNNATVSSKDNAKVSTKDCSGSIGDTVWYDENGNGKKDKGEDGIDNVKICAEDKNGKKYCDKTDKKGEYTIKNLCKGEYKVKVNEDDVKGLKQICDPDGKLDNRSKTTLKDGEDEKDMDFCYRGEAPKTGASLSATIATYVSFIAIALAAFLYWANKTGRLNKFDRWWTRRRVLGRRG